MNTTDTPRFGATSSTGTRPPRLYPWISGVTLILLGGFFLLHNIGVVAPLDHWWALFLLIPAAITAGTAWAQYQASGGRLTQAAGGSLIASVTLTALAAIFLLGLPWGTVWPVFLIIAGLTTLLQRSSWRRGDGWFGRP